MRAPRAGRPAPAAHPAPPRSIPQNGGLDGIARRIADAVRRNCGQRAVVISHSYGGNVMAAILHKPELKDWK
jgi:hypothetical protein